MNRSMALFLLAILAAPAMAYLVFRIARDLGFLDAPINAEHEQRRTIVLALYALLLFLSIFLFGWGKGWPRAWIIFGVVNGLALIAFAAIGIVAGIRLWKLRHPLPGVPIEPTAADEEAAALLPPQEPH